MKKTATLWKYFLEKVTAALTSVGAVSAPEHWTRHRWLLQTVYGSYELTVHNPELSDIYTFSVFGRFLSDGPFPAAANQHSGKLNFHLLGPETKITRADIDDFAGRLRGRLEAMRPLARENPRQDFGALERAWEGAQLRRYYASQEDGPEPKERLKLEIYEGDGIVVDTFDVERSGRGFTVTDEYLNDPDQTLDWREVNRLLAEHDPKPVKGTLVIELPAKNPLLKPKIAREGKAWRWEVKRGRRRVAGGYGRTRSDAENDAKVWLQEQARKNPVGSEAMLMFRGSLLALADDSDEENRLRAEGWDEAGDIPARKLARLRQLDPNGWAELTDRPFTEKELGDALRNVERQNPAVTGERGQYRLHYMEPGVRKGTFRQAIRRVDSVAEAERWMNDNAGRAFLPASVMTPGNRWQSPDVVAVLGPDRIPAAATATSYDRLPV